MSQNALSRLWTYQAERFPLAKTAPLLGVFSAASITVSAEMAGRPWPPVGAYVAGFAIAMTLFFQMRVCDEVKDLEDDRRFRPERPIPRGLVSLSLIRRLGIGSLPITALAAFWWHAPVLWLLALVWVWLLVMTFEFGVPAFLKARPVLYLVSHMAIMPLIDLLLTAIEWLPAGQPSRHLWLFLTLSFVNGCIIEIGRKLWAREAEIEGVDSYSRLWGPRRAANLWAGCILLALVLLLGVGLTTGTVLLCVAVGGVGAGLCLRAAREYAANPTAKMQGRMDNLAGLWVFASYAVAGFGPALSRVFQ